MRGDIQDAIVGAIHAPISYRFSDERYDGEVGAMTDSKGNISEVMLMPNSEQGREGLYHAVNDCKGPIMKERGIFKKREVPIDCPVLGRLAIGDSVVKRAVRTHITLEAYSIPSILRQPI